MCAAGTCGLRGWAMRERPEAQNRPPDWSAPGICAAKASENVPKTSEKWTPTFSKTLPRIRPMRPPPRSSLPSPRFHSVSSNLPGSPRYKGGSAACSMASKRLQMSSWRARNQSRARCFWVSGSVIVMGFVLWRKLHSLQAPCCHRAQVRITPFFSVSQGAGPRPLAAMCEGAGFCNTGPELCLLRTGKA